MTFILWSRSCINCCGVKRQPGHVSSLTRCSRHYVRGGKELKPPDVVTEHENLYHLFIAAVQMVFSEWMPLLNARDDCRRVFLVIPWIALVAIFLLLGIPLHVVCVNFSAGFNTAFPGVRPFFDFSELYGLSRHDQLRNFLDNRINLVTVLTIHFFMFYHYLKMTWSISYIFFLLPR